MYKTFFFSIVLLCCASICHSQTADQLTIFGHKLGDKFSIPECACKTTKAGLVKKIYNYVPDAEITADCFERINATPGPKVPPVVNGFVRVLFPQSNTPKICPTGEFQAMIVNSTLAKISFDIPSSDANNVLASLKEKYGTNVSVNKQRAQNGYGASVDYFTAVWTFPYMTVTFTSNQLRNFGDAAGAVIISLQDNTKQENKSNRGL